MRSRSCLLVLVAALTLMACTLGLMSWWGDRALAQLTPVAELQWDGYVIEHQWRRRDVYSATDRDRHHLRVLRDGSLVLEREFYVTEDFSSAGPDGFFGALNVDDDAELELVVCTHGVIEAIIEPDRSTGLLATHAGGYTTSRATELCSTVSRAGSRPATPCVVCCVTPIAIPAFIAILIAARRDRREEERRGRTTF